MYKLTNFNCVIEITSGLKIWFNDGEPKYHDYKSWLAAGNTPLPADLIPLAVTQTAAFAVVDAAAGAARARYITIAPGQEATYLIKAAQAAAFKAGGYAGATPGLVQAEVDATGATAQSAADSILTQQAAWEFKAGQIESVRRSAKVLVAAATTEAGIKSIIDAALLKLGAL